MTVLLLHLYFCIFKVPYIYIYIHTREQKYPSLYEVYIWRTLYSEETEEGKKLKKKKVIMYQTKERTCSPVLSDLWNVSTLARAMIIPITPIIDRSWVCLRKSVPLPLACLYPCPLVTPSCSPSCIEKSKKVQQ